MIDFSALLVGQQMEKITLKVLLMKSGHNNEPLMGRTTSKYVKFSHSVHSVLIYLIKNLALNYWVYQQLVITV